MAHISVDSESYSCRIILARHDKTVSPNELQPGSTGILLETSFTNPKHFAEHVLSKISPHIQYKEVVNYAQSLRIPLIAAEPLWSMEYYRLSRNFSLKDKLFLVLFGYFSRSASNDLIGVPGEVPADDAKITKIKRYADLVSATVPYMRINGSFKNNMMAQRLTAFAEVQKAAGTKKPRLDLIVGANHIGVVNSLHMEPGMRVLKILDDNSGKQYVVPGNLAIGHYLVYNAARRVWNSKTFQDPKLKEPC